MWFKPMSIAIFYQIYRVSLDTFAPKMLSLKSQETYCESVQ